MKFLRLLIISLVILQSRVEASDEAVSIHYQTSMEAYRVHRPELMFDGDSSTMFVSKNPPRSDDDITIIFSRPVKLKRFDINFSNLSTQDLEKIYFEARSTNDFKYLSKLVNVRSGESLQWPKGLTGLRVKFSSDLSSRVEISEIILELEERVSSKTLDNRVLLDYSEAQELKDWGFKAANVIAEWYPKICSLLSDETFKPPYIVVLKLSNKFEGVAGTAGTLIFVSGNYVKNNPQDIGMVIHELTHVVQAYPEPKPGYEKPGWLVEGIADYIRLFKFEPQAPRPVIDPDKSNYRNGYKTAAEFLNWIETNYPNTVRILNKALRAGEYEESIIKNICGKDFDALWKDFCSVLAGGSRSS